MPPRCKNRKPNAVILQAPVLFIQAPAIFATNKHVNWPGQVVVNTVRFMLCHSEIGVMRFEVYKNK
jgi:hypothetical protein